MCGNVTHSLSLLSNSSPAAPACHYSLFYKDIKFNHGIFFPVCPERLFSPLFSGAITLHYPKLLITLIHMCMHVQTHINPTELTFILHQAAVPFQKNVVPKVPWEFNWYFTELRTAEVAIDQVVASEYQFC